MLIELCGLCGLCVQVRHPLSASHAPFYRDAGAEDPQRRLDGRPCPGLIVARRSPPRLGSKRQPVSRFDGDAGPELERRLGQRPVAANRRPSTGKPPGPRRIVRVVKCPVECTTPRPALANARARDAGPWNTYASRAVPMSGVPSAARYPESRRWRPHDTSPSTDRCRPSGMRDAAGHEQALSKVRLVVPPSCPARADHDRQRNTPFRIAAAPASTVADHVLRLPAREGFRAAAVAAAAGGAARQREDGQLLELRRPDRSGQRVGVRALRHANLDARRQTDRGGRHQPATADEASRTSIVVAAADRAREARGGQAVRGAARGREATAPRESSRWGCGC